MCPQSVVHSNTLGGEMGTCVKWSPPKFRRYGLTGLFLVVSTCVFPVEPQSPNGKNINPHKRGGGSRRF